MELRDDLEVREGQHATDSRGRVHGLAFDAMPIRFVEVIHSEPAVIRGNHVHRHCVEILTVVSGDLTVYLSCSCPG